MKNISTLLIFMLVTKISFANTDTLITSGASWKYLDNGTNQGTAWRTTSFNDGSWAAGNAQLGYGDGDEVTVVSYGSNANKKYITTYFRKSFSVVNASIYSALNLELLRDDGAVVYLNGTEIARSNMPSGNVSSNTKASTDVSGAAENTFYAYAASASLLLTGTNVIAVEVHQKSGNSPDLSFDFRLMGNNTPCSIPAGMNTTSITANSATLNWNAVAGSSSYDVRYRPVGNANWVTNNTASTSYNISGLNPSTEHEWQVQTNCSGQNSGYSSSTLFITLATSCNPPSGLTAFNITASSASLSWGSVAGAVSYNVQYRTIGGTWISTSTATNSISLSGLAGAKTYEWHVQTVCNGPASSYSASSSFTTTQTAITLQREPYLLMVTPSGIHIRWRTNVSCNSRVYYGTDMSYGSTVNNATSATEHEIVLSNLSAATKYYYTVGTSTADLQGDPNNYFITSLPTGSTSPFRVWAIGDFGNGTINQNAVRDAYISYAGTNRANFWIWVGDNAYSTGTDAEYTSNVFSRYPTIFKNTPLYPGIGNHDYANGPYQSGATLDTNFTYFISLSMPRNAEAGGVASGTEKYYSYNYGNTHFIVLDSYGSLNTAGSPMYNWLQSDLTANTQRWTVCYWHHPPYSMGTHNSDTDPQLSSMRQNILPLLDQYKVDLVLCGHSHVYERSVLLSGHYGNESSLTNAMKIDAGSGNSPYYLKSSPNFTGTVYVVCGISGQGGNATVQANWPYDAMYSYSHSLYGSMILDFNNDTISAKMLTSTGSIYDQFKIVKSGTLKDATNQLFDQNNADLSVLPNPFTNDVVVKYFLKQEGACTITVYDFSGRKVFENQFQGEAGNGEITLRPESFGQNGNEFIIQLKSPDGSLQKKVIRLNGE